MIARQRRKARATMSDDLAERVKNFLDLYHVMSLATLGPDGAHAANLFYARDGLTLFWVSDADTRHSRHIAADPRVSATVAPDYSDFAAIRGLQMRGRAEHVTATMPRVRLLALL
ncbi:MAG: pyridoxamine 5'-phosphate oxidase family protein, partial [Bradyrhizobium sp.]